MPKITLDYRYSALDKRREYFLACDSLGAWYFWFGYHLSAALPRRLRDIQIYPWHGLRTWLMPAAHRLRDWNTASARKAGQQVALAITKHEVALDAAGKP